VNNLRLQAGRPIVRGTRLRRGFAGRRHLTGTKGEPPKTTRSTICAFAKVTRAWAARCTTSSATRALFASSVSATSDKCSPDRFQEITSKYASLRIGVVGDFPVSIATRNRPSQTGTSIETGLPVHNVVNVRSQPGAPEPF